MALIDGDVLCYLAFEPRWLKNTDKFGITKVVLDDEGKPVPKVYTAEEDAIYLRQTYDRLKKNIRDLVDTLFCKDFMLAVQGPDNFRALMYEGYKKSRGNYKPSEYSKFVPILRKLLIKEGLAIPSIGMEADDFLRIWARECEEAGQEFVIASIDKDLKCIPGTHYNIKKEEFEIVTKEAAERLYYEQLIKGDQIDNIPGIPGIGDKKAQKALEGCTTTEEYQEAVVGLYIQAYGEDWEHYLLINGKLIHIKNAETDVFDLEDWGIVSELRYG